VVQPSVPKVSDGEYTHYEETAEAELFHGNKYVFDATQNAYFPVAQLLPPRREAELMLVPSEPGADHAYRLAWIWVEGWRGRLRRSGDLVEKCRWEWRVDDVLIKDARAGVLEMQAAAEALAATRLKKSVHWAD
jgi:hypothetical protein